MLGILRRVNDAKNLNSDNIIKKIEKEIKRMKGIRGIMRITGITGIMEIMRIRGVREIKKIMTNNSDAKVETQVKGYVIPLSYPYYVGTKQFSCFSTPCCDLLFLAVLCNFKEIVKAILERLQNNTESNIINQLLYPNALRDNDSMLIEMLEREITDEISKERMISHVERRDDTYSVLLLAAELGHKDVVEHVLDKGANIGRKNKDGDTALHLAARDGHLEVVQCLTENGANINAKNGYGNIPLHFAARGGHLEIVKYFVEKDAASVNLQNRSYDTPLLFAIRNNHADVVAKLLEKGADVNIESFYTPLYLAVRNEFQSTTNLLIAHEVKLKGSGAQKPVYLKDPDTDLRKSMSKYWDECLDEIKRMKEEKVGNDITFYDILIGKNDQSISHILRAKTALDKGEHKKFPIYADEIGNQHIKLEKRLSSLDEASDNLCQVFPRDRAESLPKEISVEIVKHLSDVDIENFNTATRNNNSYTKRLL